ncbi:hypothetical protein GA0070622_0887 [Micromonospora sediminicola]|uniref:Uncharacterized protein n=1 Tax=Micromonospora sediminicola TaxID=946078 RepID=A0A1A9B4G8_9ACTN|nr:hypothetical protein [Micromonospora sediminicola]SBT63919.1 hypothetical protein GA0070622_0887 [Micromonospora sediminicola]
MAESSYPNPGVTEAQHERLLGRALPSGLLGHPDDQPLVYADGTGTREIRIRASRQGAVEGYGWANDAAVITKTLAANTSGSTRVDLVVLRLNRSTWTVTVQIVQGTPGAGAPAATRTPATGGGTIYEIELATVTVANNATTLAGSTVTDKAWYLNEDGQILCESDRRPPHHPGRSAFETDTGRWILSDGTVWRNAVDDSGLLAVSMLSGFGATENTLQRRGGVCVLNIKVQRTNAAFPAGSTTKVANLPAGCTPTFPVQSAVMWWSGAQVAGLRVTSSGLYVVTPAGVTVAEDRTVDGSLVWHAAS